MDDSPWISPWISSWMIFHGFDGFAMDFPRTFHEFSMDLTDFPGIFHGFGGFPVGLMGFPWIPWMIFYG